MSMYHRLHRNLLRDKWVFSGIRNVVYVNDVFMSVYACMYMGNICPTCLVYADYEELIKVELPKFMNRINIINSLYTFHTIHTYLPRTRLIASI